MTRVTDRSTGAPTLQTTLDLLADVLGGPARAEIVAGLLRGTGHEGALRRLRRSLRRQSFEAGGRTHSLEKPVRRLDHRTRSEGFRVLHSWNHRLHAFTEDTTPVLMLDYFERTGPEDPHTETVVRILLDYYFLHVLTLCAMRAWDDPSPDEVLDQVTDLLDALQGPGGSGHRFLASAETALLYALSQFHPEEQAYDRFIDRVRGLRADRQVRFAAASAAVLGCHLRWGFWLMYGRDVISMRRDNVGDYPWLLYTVSTLLRAYDASEDHPESSGDGSSGRGLDRDAVVGALLQGLAADPWAFTGAAPTALAGHAVELAATRALLDRHGEALLEAFEAHRPGRGVYAPLSLHFNFPHNTLVALVAMALLDGRPETLPLDRLFVRDETGKTELAARAIMAYSGASPDRLGAHGARLVAYDPLSGMRSYSMTVDALRERLGKRPPTA